MVKVKDGKVEVNEQLCNDIGKAIQEGLYEYKDVINLVRFIDTRWLRSENSCTLRIGSSKGLTISISESDINNLIITNKSNVNLLELDFSNIDEAYIHDSKIKTFNTARSNIKNFIKDSSSKVNLQSTLKEKEEEGV